MPTRTKYTIKLRTVGQKKRDHLTHFNLQYVIKQTEIVIRLEVMFLFKCMLKKA